MADLSSSPLSVANEVNNNPQVWHNNFFGLEMPVDVLSIIYSGTVALGGAIGYFTKGLIAICFCASIETIIYCLQVVFHHL